MRKCSRSSTRERATRPVAAVGSPLFTSLYGALGAEEVVASDVAAELAELSEGGYGLIVVEGCEDYRLRDLKYRRPIPLVVSMPALRIKSWRSTRVS